MSKGENTAKWIKGQRVSWLHHLERMEDDRMPKKILTHEMEGMRRRGRPRKGWKEEVERDLQVLGVRKFNVVTENPNCNAWSKHVPVCATSTKNLFYHLL